MEIFPWTALMLATTTLSVTMAAGRWMLLDHAGSRRRQAREEERRIVSPKCVDVPNNMVICSAMEYSLMKMPNILGHDTIKEARTEADAWLPLADSGCNPNTALFICSMFAPVCVPEMTEMVLPPCRELCREVKESCSPVMERFGFVWPAMFDCSQFPPATSYMCVDSPSTRNGRDQDPEIEDDYSGRNDTSDESDEYDECNACGQSVDEHIENDKQLDLICSSGVVMKVKVRRVVYKNDDIQLTAIGKKTRFYKASKDLKTKLKTKNTLAITLKDTLTCDCDIEEGKTRSYYLVTGFAVNGEIYATFVHPWTQEAKRYAKKLKKRCAKRET